MHDPVHDKGAPGHVPRVLEDGDEGEEDEDVGEEHHHGSHAPDEAVLDEGDHCIGESGGGQESGGPFAQGFEESSEDLHQGIPQGIGEPEDGPCHQKEQGKAEGPRRHNPVDPVGKGQPCLQREIPGHRFGGHAGDETPAPLDHRRLEVISEGGFHRRAAA